MSASNSCFFLLKRCHTFTPLHKKKQFKEITKSFMTVCNPLTSKLLFLYSTPHTTLFFSLKCCLFLSGLWDLTLQFIYCSEGSELPQPTNTKHLHSVSRGQTEGSYTKDWISDGQHRTQGKKQKTTSLSACCCPSMTMLWHLPIWFI